MESQILEKMMRKMQNMDDRLNAISVAASDQHHFDHSMTQTVAGDEVEHSGMPTIDDMCENEFNNGKFEENTGCEDHLKFINNLCKEEDYKNHSSESVDQCNKYKEYANNFCGDSEYRKSNEDFCKDLSS